MKRRVFLGLPVILGILFYIWYIFHASDNVAYSDYIRLINSYLPDVTNPAKFFVPDILTRVPITYLGRIINVKLFGYNAYFDMILGVLSLGAGAAVLALYAERNRSVGYLSFLLIQFVYFSLNKWEMMTNGTGWVCTLSISGFLFHLAVLDHAAATRCRNMSASGNSADPAGRAGGRTVQRRLCGDSGAGIRRTVAGGSARGC